MPKPRLIRDVYVHLTELEAEALLGREQPLVSQSDRQIAKYHSAVAQIREALREKRGRPSPTRKPRRVKISMRPGEILKWLRDRMISDGLLDATASEFNGVTTVRIVLGRVE